MTGRPTAGVRARRSAPRGTLLVDALVALAILAGSLGAVVAATAGSLRVVRRLSEAVTAQIQRSTASTETFHARATYR